MERAATATVTAVVVVDGEMEVVVMARVAVVMVGGWMIRQLPSHHHLGVVAKVMAAVAMVAGRVPEVVTGVQAMRVAAAVVLAEQIVRSKQGYHHTLMLR